jgi:hypothetical protein
MRLWQFHDGLSQTGSVYPEKKTKIAEVSQPKQFQPYQPAPRFPNEFRRRGGRLCREERLWRLWGKAKSKSEIQISKSETIPKSKSPKSKRELLPFWILLFGDSDLFRISDFGFFLPVVHAPGSPGKAPAESSPPLQNIAQVTQSDPG